MVGLPARGKSYITKKTARYLNWLQHDTRIFNVGERRRVVAGGQNRLSGVNDDSDRHGPTVAAQILINGQPEDVATATFQALPPPMAGDESPTPAGLPHLEKWRKSDGPIGPNQLSAAEELPSTEGMEQSANFFDPKNVKAAQIREQVSMSTLDELLDYVLVEGGSVGLLDATNSTLERRKMIMKRIRERAGPELGVLFLESLCVDENVRAALLDDSLPPNSCATTDQTG